MAKKDSGRERKGGNESNLGAWPQYAEPVESDTSPCGRHMEPIVAAAQEGREQGIREGVARSDSFYTGKARLMELKDDTDVNLWPSQPSVTGNRPSHIGPRHAVEVVGDL